MCSETARSSVSFQYKIQKVKLEGIQEPDTVGHMLHVKEFGIHPAGTWKASEEFQGVE